MSYRDDAIAFRAALERYRARHCAENPAEAAVVDRFLELLEDGEDAFHRHHARGHLTASAVIMDRDATQVLLTHHRKLDIWIQLGGHADGDANLPRAALREAEEESGLRDLVLVSREIVDLDIHPIPAHGGEPPHEHFDVRYAMIGDPARPLVVSDESHDLAWVRVDELCEYSSEASLRRAVGRACRAIRPADA